jgi:hypothetical protein
VHSGGSFRLRGSLEQMIKFRVGRSPRPSAGDRRRMHVTGAVAASVVTGTAVQFMQKMIQPIVVKSPVFHHGT